MNGFDILHKVSQLPVSTWRYHWEEDHVRHLGPMAQDWYATFGFGTSSQQISIVDANGVSLVAIQALHQHIVQLRADLTELQRRLDQAPPSAPSARTTRLGVGRLLTVV